MTDESDDRTLRIRAASHRAMGAIACAASAGGVAAWTAAADALADALIIVDARNTPERDERTRDLEELTNERNALAVEKDRQLLRANRFLDERDAEKRLAKMANDELEKARALVDELRAALAAPSMQSAAVKAWLSYPESERRRIINSTAGGVLPNIWSAAADVLDSLSTQAQAASSAEITDRSTADTVGRLTRERDAARALVRTLEARQAAFSKALDDSAAWRALSARDRGHVLLWLGEGKQETRDPSRWAAAVTALKSLMVQT